MNPRQESEVDRLKLLAGALGRIASGLFVVTGRHGVDRENDANGEDETGMLASWVQQCSFDPPQLSMAIRQGRVLNTWLEPGAAFTINVLERSQTDMIAHFGRGFAPGEPAFTGLEVERPGGAPPVLPDVLAYLECRVTARYSAGDHDLIIGRVVAGRVLGDGQPMIHVRKSGLHY